MAKSTVQTRKPTPWWLVLLGGIVAAVVVGLLALLAAYWADAHFTTSTAGAQPQTDLATWFGGFGAVLAIAAGFTSTILLMRQSENDHVRRRTDLGEVAGNLARQSLQLATDRLEVALNPKRPGFKPELREYRTIEMVSAMREFDPASLPPEIVVSFAKVRSCVSAINTRISELYSLEEQLSGWDRKQATAKRHAALASCVTVHQRACEAFECLRNDIQALGGNVKQVRTSDDIAGYRGS